MDLAHSVESEAHNSHHLTTSAPCLNLFAGLLQLASPPLAGSHQARRQDILRLLDLPLLFVVISGLLRLK